MTSVHLLQRRAIRRTWHLLLAVFALMAFAVPQQAYSQSCSTSVHMNFIYPTGCNWQLWLNNNLPNVYHIRVVPVAPVTFNGSTANAGYSTVFSPTLATWNTAGATPFPMGTNIVIGSLDINPNGVVPQIVIVEYYDNRGNLLCRERIEYIDCPPDVGDPCDQVDLQPVFPTNYCNWVLRLTNGLSNIYQISIVPIGAVTFNTATANTGFTNMFSSTLSSWYRAGGGPFPTGSSIDIGSLDINPNGTFPQQLVVEYYDKAGTLLCRDTITVDCPVPSGCADQPDVCVTNTMIVSTGYDHSAGGMYAAPAQDAYWTLVSAPNFFTPSIPRPAEVVLPIAAWSTALTTPPSQWISAFPNPASNQVNMPPDEPYSFERCFCICAPDQGDLHFQLQLLADNVAFVYFDGVLIGQTNPASVSSNFTTPTVIDVIVPYVGAGTHCLRIDLHNDHNASPMAVRLSGTVTGANFLTELCCDPNKAAVVGYKYHDKNCNGTRDQPNNPGLEPGLQGWTIELWQSGSLIQTQVTDVNGYYAFTGLPGGTYTVCEVQQAGWTQSQPGGSGCYTFSLASNGIIQLDFGNCEDVQDSCDQFSDGAIDSVCCGYTLGIVNIPGNIVHVKYNITGGVTNYVSSYPCSPSSTTPPSLFGQVSGTLHYGPPCASNLNIDIGVTPTTASGAVTIDWVVYHLVNGELDSCLYTSHFTCMPTPTLKCDSLEVQPFVFAGLDLSGRTFTVHNNKMPASPICRIDIELSPAPLGGSYAWAGGGLVVDGSSRGWSFPYTHIDFAAGGNTTPSGSANNTVQFNLGVDYTLNWTGAVHLKVIHCDGDTCIVTLPEWCAKENPDECAASDAGSASLTPVAVDKEKLHIARFAVDGSASTKWISVQTDGDANVVFAAGSVHNAEDNVSLRLHGVPAGNHVLYEVVRTAGSEADDFTGSINLVLEHTGEEASVPNIRWTAYDSESNPFAQGDAEVSGSAITTEVPASVFDPSASFRLLQSVPNPTSGETTIYYHLDREMDVKIELYNNLGRIIDVLETGSRSAGVHSLQYHAGNLGAGVYYLRLSAAGRTVSLPLTIVR